MQSRQRRTVPLGLMLLVAFLLASCSGDSDDETDNPVPTSAPNLPPSTPVLSATLDADGDGFLVDNEFEQALSLAIDEYQWPAGYGITSNAILEYASGGRNISLDTFQPGLEYDMLSVYNRCAWNMTWLDARRSGDAALETEALDALNNVLPNNPRTQEQSRASLVQAAEKASLGDPSEVQRSVELSNCADLPLSHNAATPTGTPRATPAAFSLAQDAA